MSNSRINFSSALVYIAGIEVPALDVSVTYGTEVMPRATITLAAAEELIRFGEEDRVPVAIFYYDQWYSKDGPGGKVDPTYRLLFDGDIVGWAYTKNASGDMVVLSCESTLAAMQQMRGMFLSGDNKDQEMLFESHVTGEQMGKLDVNAPGFPNNLFFKGLFPGNKGNAAVRRPIDFVSNLVFSMKVGGYVNKDSVFDKDGFFTGAAKQLVNDSEGLQRIPTSYYDSIRDQVFASSTMTYFLTYSHKTRFDKRWIATPFERIVGQGDDYTLRHTADTQFAAIQSLATQQASNKAVLANFTSHSDFLEILKTYYNVVQYEILALPTAPYVSVGSPDSPDSFTVTRGGGDKALGNFISKALTPFAIAPQFNVLFSSMVTNFTFNESYLDQATRYFTLSSPSIESSQGVAPASESAAFLMRIGGLSAWPPDAYPPDLATKGASPYGTLLYPEEFFRGPKVYNDSAPTWYQYSSSAASDIHKTGSILQTAADIRKSLGVPAQEDLGLGTIAAQLTAESKATDAQNIADAKFKVDFAKNLARNPSQTRELLEGYTRQKYFEARYRYRSGMSSTIFNPYMVPSYPMVFIDGGNAGVHITALVTSVTHSISAFGGASTSVNYVYGRTMKEMYEDVISMVLTKAVSFRYMSAPVLPYVSQASAFQLEDNAASHYADVFYQGEEKTGGHAKAFIAKNYFLTTQGVPGFPDAPTARAPEKINGKTVVNVSLVLSGKHKTALEDHDVAMRQVARPICTLAEYISFINRGTTMTAMLVKGSIAIGSYGVEVPVYLREYLYSKTPVADGSTNDPENLEGYIFPRRITGKDVSHGDFRRDWVRRLKNYRKKIYLKTVMGA